ncbi:hypothetical protein NAI47_10435, partial [Francisella tularensis subsp. holarctica]|nr:hypothetical protein [Francisella tularensis subsp. holarctica]
TSFHVSDSGVPLDFTAYYSNTKTGSTAWYRCKGTVISTGNVELDGSDYQIPEDDIKVTYNIFLNEFYIKFQQIKS